jgi:hypothetical protein
MDENTLFSLFSQIKKLIWRLFFMSKFNMSQKGINTTTNLAGGKAYVIGDKEKLTKMALTSFFKEPKFYGDTSNEIIDTAQAVINTDAKYVANLAIYAREVMHLRSVSQALLVELANHPKGKEFVRRATNKIVERADDMTEIMAYQISAYGKPIPNSMKKGIADVFPRFNEYALAKYDRAKSVTLKDLLCLTRPKPLNEAQGQLWKRLIEGKMETPKTWETELSAKGNKAEVWDGLIKEKKIGYMAALRNLRNLVTSNAQNLDDILTYIQNPEAVLKSKQLPFRYFSAYKELENTSSNKVINAISNAMEIAVKNLPRLQGKTFMMGDNSGSMDSTLSQYGKVTFKEISALFMAIAEGFCDEAITSVFGDKFSLVNVLTKDTIFSKMDKFKRTNVGCSTNLWTAVKYAVDNKIFTDRMIVFTDEQCYNNYRAWNSTETASTYFERYLKEVNPKCFMHLINLNSQDGTTQFLGKNVNYIAGWSEKIFEFIPMFEDDNGSLVKTIEKFYFK